MPVFAVPLFPLFQCDSSLRWPAPSGPESVLCFQELADSMALGKTASSYEDQGLIALMGPSDALECQGLDVSVVGESWCPALSVASRGVCVVNSSSLSIPQLCSLFCGSFIPSDSALM